MPLIMDLIFEFRTLYIVNERVFAFFVSITFLLHMHDSIHCTLYNAHVCKVTTTILIIMKREKKNRNYRFIYSKLGSVPNIFRILFFVVKLLLLLLVERVAHCISLIFRVVELPTTTITPNPIAHCFFHVNFNNLFVRIWMVQYFEQHFLAL